MDTCKHCGTELIVKQTKRTSEQLKKPYYYTAYYFCPNCKKLYHDEKFKVVNQHMANSLWPMEASDKLSAISDKPYDAHIWTDGACTRNGYENARAAWAFVSGETEKAGVVIGKQTNNTAEGYAIYHALLWAAEEKHKKVKIYSDSQITLNNLKKSSYRIKENRSIFELIEDVIAANGLEVDFEKVPAHADNINNNRADRLANTLAGIK
jgi:ribonuclease HI